MLTENINPNVLHTCFTYSMIGYSSLHIVLFAIELLKTSKFEWKLNNRIKTIISAPILATIFFSGFRSTRCKALSQAVIL